MVDFAEGMDFNLVVIDVGQNIT